MLSKNSNSKVAKYARAGPTSVVLLHEAVLTGDVVRSIAPPDAPKGRDFIDL